MIHPIEHKRNLGSATLLIGEQKLLFIFVDDYGAGPWTADLRRVVEAKVESGLRWIESQARSHGVRLQFHCVFAPVNTVASHCWTTINETDLCAGPHHATWQNQVVTNLTSSGSVASRWNDLFEACGLPLNRSDGSAVLFCVRRYFPSIAFPFLKGENSEFQRERGIIYDNGGEEGQWFLDSQIAHEILHLYGAVDLSPNKAPVQIKDYITLYVDDVMHTPTQGPLNQYNIGDLTRYLIGWCQAKPDWLK